MVQLRSRPSRHVPAARRLSKDDLPAIGISRLRATGVVTPNMSAIAINIGDGLERPVKLAHTRFPNGGGWSYFVCPQCGHRTRTLRLTDQGNLVCRRCDGLLYRCQHHDKESRVAHLRALLYGAPARHKPRWLRMDRRRSLEAALRRLLIRERQQRLERVDAARKRQRASRLAPRL
jgi:Transposase zinc-ribbon domain